MKVAAICLNDVFAPRFLVKNIVAVLLISIAASVMSACGKQEAPIPSQYAAELEKQRERADREQKAKEVEQQQRQVAEERADFWKTMVWIVVIAGVIFTLVGIAIGSSARKKAEKTRANE